MMVIDSAKCLCLELQHSGLRPGLAARRKGRFESCVGYNNKGAADPERPVVARTSHTVWFDSITLTIKTPLHNRFYLLIIHPVSPSNRALGVWEYEVGEPVRIFGHN